MVVIILKTVNQYNMKLFIKDKNFERSRFSVIKKFIKDEKVIEE